MKLKDYRIIFVAASLIGVLVIATPAISGLIHLPSTDPFSELYLLGPEHMAANYPFSIVVGQNYTVYIDVENHMYSSTYYLLNIKFTNASDSIPNATTGAPSSIAPLYEYRFVLTDNELWEVPLTFSVPSISYLSGNQSMIQSIKLNGVSFNINKPVLNDSNTNSFDCQLLFELWTYNDQTNTTSYDNRFVALKLNLPQSD